VGILAFAASIASAATVSLAWDYVDQGQEGFKIYYGTTSHAAVEAPENPNSSDPAPYTTQVVVPMASTRTATLTVTPGTYYMRITAYGTTGAESIFSNEVVANVTHSAPGNLRITIVVVGP